MVVLTCFVKCGSAYVCVCLVISVLVITVFCIACTVFLYCFVYVYLFLFVFLCEPGSSVGIATDYGLDGPGSNPGGEEIFRPSKPALGTRPFPGVNCGRGVLLTTHPLLVPRSWKSRAIPLATLWATPGL